MMADKVRALCGKWVLPKKKALHERLCTKCAELSSPAENTAVGVPLQPIPLVDVPPEAIVEGGKTQQPGAEAPEIVNPPPDDPPESDQPGEDDFVDRAAQKVVAMIAPSLNQTLQQVNTLIEQTKAAKPLTPEQIEQVVDRHLIELRRQVEEQASAQAGGNGHAVAESGAVMAAPAGGGGADMFAGLLGVIQQAAPLFRQQAPAGGSLTSIVESLKGLSELRQVMSDMFDEPKNRAKMETLQEVRMLAQLSSKDGLADIAGIMESQIPKPVVRESKPS